MNYQEAMNSINSLLANEGGTLDDETNVSAFTFKELLENRFSPFYNYFNDGKIPTHIRALLYDAFFHNCISRSMFYFDNFYPFFSANTSSIVFKVRCHYWVVQQDNDERNYCFNPSLSYDKELSTYYQSTTNKAYSAQSVFVKTLQDNEIISEIFNFMSPYKKYSDYLGYQHRNDDGSAFLFENKDKSIAAKITLNWDGSIKCQVTMPEVSPFLMSAKWSDNRISIEECLIQNEEEILRNIFTPVSSLPAIFREAYLKSLSCCSDEDIPHKQFIK